MKFLIHLLRKITPKEVSKPVGRWSIEQCNIKVNNRVDLSNEDHCGPCGQYALNKIDTKINNPKPLDVQNPYPENK
jgi:hypothetical protein